MTESTRRRRGLAVELAIVCALFLCGYVLGRSYIQVFHESGAPYDFAQIDFGAAIAQACGHGFRDPGREPNKAIADFLNVRRDAIACADLPPAGQLVEPNITQRLYRYLMQTAAVVWRIRGISWTKLWPVFGVAVGVTFVVLYGLFRLGMNRPLAVAMTMAAGFSSIHVGYIPYLRDYAKGPLILALVVVLAWIGLSARDAVRRCILLSALFGVVLGIGFGFRNDLMIMIPPFALVVFVAVGDFTGRGVLLKASCAVAAAATFVVTSWPIITAYSNGSNTGHVMLLGLMTPFDDAMGLTRSVYDWGYQYSDSLANTLVNSYSTRTIGKSVSLYSRDYDHEMFRYLGLIARHFPADLAVRAVASTLRILDLPFASGSYTNVVPYGVKSPALSSWYMWAGRNLRSLSGAGVFIGGITLLVLSARSFVKTLLLAVLLAYFAAYPAVQFHVRHFFHLEFLTWWAIGFWAQMLLDVRKWTLSDALSRPAIVRAAAFAALVIVGVVIPVWALRGYQQVHAKELLEQYRQAKVVDVTQTRTVVDGRLEIAFPDLWTREYVIPASSSPDPEVRSAAAERLRTESIGTQMMVAEFTPAGCPDVAMPLTIHYDSKVESTDFSRKLVVPLDDPAAPAAVLFGAFWDKGWSSFTRLEMPAADAPCLKQIRRIEDVTAYPLVLNVMYDAAWTDRPLYQTLRDWGSRDLGRHGRILTAPDTLAVRRRDLDVSTGAAVRDVVFTDPIARVNAGGGWLLRGAAASHYGYLLMGKPYGVDNDVRVVVEGELRHGAITVGVLRDGKWVRTLNIEAPGRFVAVVGVPGRGEVQPVIANVDVENIVEQHRTVARALRAVHLLGPSTDATITSIRVLDDRDAAR